MCKLHSETNKNTNMQITFMNFNEVDVTKCEYLIVPKEQNSLGRVN